MVKGKLNKNQVLTVNLKHDGFFTLDPFEYLNGDEKQITYINFKGMSFDAFRDIIRHLVHAIVASLYYCKVGTSLRVDITALKNDAGVDDFVNLGYENKWVVYLYVEHNGYDVFDIRDQLENMVHNEDNESSDDEELSFVDFHTEADNNVDWKKMELVLGMRFEHPEQLKLCLANYGIANDYQFWYKRNDCRQLLVFCGRDVQTGRCDGYNTKKRKAQKQLFSTESDDIKPKDGARKRMVKVQISLHKQIASLHRPLPTTTGKSGEGCSESPKWTKSRVASDRDTFLPYLKMKSDIREKYLINVSIGQCKRAKQRALYNFEEGLKEHYGRLWEYRQAVFDPNPRSTCRIDDEVTSSGNNYFRRIYVCFKGVKDGWLAGCRKVIELDGCFPKHTCRGELLVAMGRDSNNQMRIGNWIDWFIRWICPNFERNGNCGSFNMAILVQRTKPIITILKDIILYLMQILVSINRIARTYKDIITPSIRKRIELLKEEQRFWIVIPSGFQELEVRKGHGAYGMNIQLRTCMCRMWQLIGIPCIHLVTTYCHMNRDHVEGVDHWYSNKDGLRLTSLASGLCLEVQCGKE
ncbi:calcium/proton exchanger [Tanacetum coccineum]|uniref:Calcium/proton exchanger n=1 Tax=Tanacetum coccineum TaxID=301880 RepID=A0ABQ4YNH2_9ASTR